MHAVGRPQCMKWSKCGWRPCLLVLIQKSLECLCVSLHTHSLPTSLYGSRPTPTTGWLNISCYTVTYFIKRFVIQGCRIGEVFISNLQPLWSGNETLNPNGTMSWDTIPWWLYTILVWRRGAGDQFNYTVLSMVYRIMDNFPTCHTLLKLTLTYSQHLR